MLCALFESYLLLAQARKEGARFEIAAVISLRNLQMDKADNGRGKEVLAGRSSRTFADLSKVSSAIQHYIRGRSCSNQISNSMN